MTASARQKRSPPSRVVSSESPKKRGRKSKHDVDEDESETNTKDDALSQHSTNASTLKGVSPIDVASTPIEDSTIPIPVDGDCTPGKTKPIPLVPNSSSVEAAARLTGDVGAIVECSTTEKVKSTHIESGAADVSTTDAVVETAVTSDDAATPDEIATGNADAVIVEGTVLKLVNSGKKS